MKQRCLTLAFVVVALGLSSCGGGSKPGEPIVKGDAAHGQQVYAQTCASCHGQGGKGDGPAAGAIGVRPADHTNKTTIGGLTDEKLTNIIKMGGGIVGKPTMPAFPALSDKDVNDLVAHLRAISGTEHH